MPPPILESWTWHQGVTQGKCCESHVTKPCLGGRCARDAPNFSHHCEIFREAGACVFSSAPFAEGYDWAGSAIGEVTGAEPPPTDAGFLHNNALILGGL